VDKDDGFGGNPRAVTYDSVGSEPLGMYKHVQYPKPWVGLTQTQVKLLREGVEKESIKTGDSIDWVFYTHINAALKEKNT
jgi:hypothetical protein